MQPLRVYLSSTFEDLKVHRDAVNLALAKSGVTVARMEDYVAADQRPLDLCLQDVARSDVFVGVYAWRYGYEPPAEHGNPDGCSITHLEYRQAEASGLRKLLFFAHPETRAHWPAAFCDDLSGRIDGAEKLSRFRQTVGTEKTVSFFRSEDELATLVLAAIMRSGLSGRVYNVPPLPPAMAARSSLVDAVVEGVVGPGQQPGGHTLIQGAGGFGKTTLALLTCHRPDVVQAYPDGLLWTSLGETPDVGRALGDLYALVTGKPVAVADVDAIAGALAKALQGRRCLVVVDDVWREDDLAPFMRLSGPRLLVTTRHRALVQQTAQEPWPEVPVDEMSVQEAGEMLGRGLVLDAAAEAALRDLAQRLGCWPLLLDLAAARLREEHKRGRGSLAQCLAFVFTLFEKKGVLGFDRRESQARNAAVARSVDVGLELADQMFPDAALTRRAAELSIFPENLAIPLTVLAELWGLDEFDLEEEVVRPLDQISLLRWDRQAGTVSLHMMVHRVLDARLKSHEGGAAAVHRRLLTAWGDPLQLPHAHAWRWMGWHCLQAGDGARLGALLLDLDWIRARLHAATQMREGRSWTDLTEVLRDYALLADDEAVREVGRALRASERLRVDPALLCQQLHGRLDGSSLAPSRALARAALDRVARHEALVPAWAALEPPAAVLDILRHVHDVRVGRPQLMPDGRRVLVSDAGGRSMLLDTGDGFRRERQVELPAPLLQVLPMPDARHVLYLCGHVADGGCVEAWRWNFEQGGDPCLVARWDTCDDWLFEAAPGHRRALVMAPAAGLITLVDLENDCAPMALDAVFGEAAAVLCVTFGPRGLNAVLHGHHLRDTQVIDLQRGGQASRVTVRPVAGRPPDWVLEADVREVAFGANDDLVVLTLGDSQDAHLWRFGEPAVPLVMGGDAGWAMPLPDGRHVLACDFDAATEAYAARVLSPWPEQGSVPLEDQAQTVAMLDGWPDHRVLSPDGRHLLLVGETSVTVLALPERGLPTVVACCSSGVDRHGGAAWLPDSRRVLLHEDDHPALRCWDIGQAGEPAVLNGIDSGIAGALPLGDGQRVVTFSAHGTLQLWDLGLKQVSRPRVGHDRAVTSAVTVLDGSAVVTNSADESCRLWDVQTGAERLRLRVDLPDGLRAVTPLRDGRRALLSTRMDRVLLADLSTGQVTPAVDAGQVHAHDEGWYWVAVGDDSLVVVFEGSAHEERNRFVVRRMAAGTVAPSLFASGLGSVLFRLEADGQAVRLWEEEDEVVRLYSPLGDERLLAMTVRPIPLEDGGVVPEISGCLHDLTPAAELAITGRLEPWRGTPGQQFHRVMATPGARWALAWGDSETLLAWRLDRPGPPVELVGHEAGVFGVLAMPDGQRALSWSSDGTLRLWALENGQPLAVLHCEAGGVDEARLLPCGRRVVCTSWDTVYLWDLDAGAVLAYHGFDARVTALDLHPDGSRVFVGDEGGRIQFLQIQPPG